MHTGAHPDDEDSALLARLARGDHARVAYLALNRGEGGQNIIGRELFDQLGVIRTEELLQARRIDGADQLFTRTVDFGFSKTREEAGRVWGEEIVLDDMVRAIRAYRPLVVISRFSGTPNDGHGHHQLAGYLTPVAVARAADPAAFPEHRAEGLRPWRVLKVYVGEGFRPSTDGGPALRVETGDVDPLLGRSYFELAMEGRSLHRSQRQGALELRGPRASVLRLLSSAAPSSPEALVAPMFSGIDTSIAGIPSLAGAPATALGAELARRADGRGTRAGVVPADDTTHHLAVDPRRPRGDPPGQGSARGARPRPGHPRRDRLPSRRQGRGLRRRGGTRCRRCRRSAGGPRNGRAR